MCELMATIKQEIIEDVEVIYREYEENESDDGVDYQPNMSLSEHVKSIWGADQTDCKPKIEQLEKLLIGEQKVRMKTDLSFPNNQRQTLNRCSD